MKYKKIKKIQLDPIVFAKTRWPKVSLNSENPIDATIGVIKDDLGRVFRPDVINQEIKESWQAISDNSDFGYQTMIGNPHFLDSIKRLIFSSDSSSMIKTQSFGGSGALYLASEFIKEVFEISKVFYDPGWGNYSAIFRDFELSTYSRIVDNHPGYDHQSYIKKLSDLSSDSAIVIQLFGYNDDGHDRSLRQLSEVLDLAKEKGILVIVDSAYLGLANSFEEDKKLITLVEKSGASALVCLSCSKNLGLYQERIGALFGINLDYPEISVLQSYLEIINRRTYSFLTRLVSEAVARVLDSTEKSEVLFEQIESARNLIIHRREKFIDILGPDFDWLKSHNGLFIKLFDQGFSDQQQQKIEDQGILILASSRINIGGIIGSDIYRVANIIKGAL